MQMHSYLEDAVNCKECSHKDVCSFKKEDGRNQILYPEVDYVSVKVTCNHFRKIQNPFVPRDGSDMKLDEKATREILFGVPEFERQLKPGMPDIFEEETGTEYLQNQLTCSVTERTSEKSCKGCVYENNSIRFDQSPCWGCKENGYSKFEERKSLRKKERIRNERKTNEEAPEKADR